MSDDPTTQNILLEAVYAMYKQMLNAYSYGVERDSFTKADSNFARETGLARVPSVDTSITDLSKWLVFYANYAINKPLPIPKHDALIAKYLSVQHLMDPQIKQPYKIQQPHVSRGSLIEITEEPIEGNKTTQNVVKPTKCQNHKWSVWTAYDSDIIACGLYGKFRYYRYCMYNACNVVQRAIDVVPQEMTEEES